MNDELTALEQKPFNQRTALEIVVTGYEKDDSMAEKAAAELADYELRLDLLAKGATWEHEENERLREDLEIKNKALTEILTGFISSKEMRLIARDALKR